MNNVRELFEECYKKNIDTILVDVVLPKIQEFLKDSKSVDVTLDELREALELPVKVSDTAVISSQALENDSIVPPVMQRSSTRGGRKRGTRGAATAKEHVEGKCKYQLRSGNRKGFYCNGNVDEDSEYCKRHKDKNPPKQKKSTSKTESVKDTGLIMKKEEPKEMALIVNPYHDIESHYFHPDTRFIIVDEDDVLCVIAKDEETEGLRVLTEQEKAEASKYNLVTLEDSDKEQQSLEKLKETLSKANNLSNSKYTEEEGEGDEELPDEEGDKELPDEEGDKELPDEGTSADMTVEDTEISTEKEEFKAKKDIVPVLPAIPDVPNIG